MGKYKDLIFNAPVFGLNVLAHFMMPSSQTPNRGNGFVSSYSILW